MTDKDKFSALTQKLVDGLLREALGYRIEYSIPFFDGIVGYMVEAPMLWIRRSRFPVFFIAYDRQKPDILTNIVKQIQIAKATEYFALLIVVPTSEGTGNESEELRRTVANSVYRQDFVVLDRRHLESIIIQNSSQRLIEIILEQGIDLTTLSPYVVVGPVPDSMFFGREKEIKIITQSISNSNFAVVGGRRIGKSSILQKVVRLLNSDPRYKAYYLNCEHVNTRADFFSVFSDEFGELQDIVTPSLFRKQVRAIKSTLPDRTLVFVMDEIDDLLDCDVDINPRGALFKVFRSLSHEAVCRFVFSGSQTLYQQLHDPKSPFFNYCEEIILGHLTEKSVAEILNKPMKQFSIELVDERKLIDELILLTSCHPNLVQWLCNKLINTLEARQVTVEKLRSLAESIDFKKHVVETSWGDAGALEKLITLIMDESTFSLTDLYERLAKYHVEDRQKIGDALSVLQLYAFFSRSGDQFRFILPHFPKVVREVEDVDSLATILTTHLEE